MLHALLPEVLAVVPVLEVELHRVLVVALGYRESNYHISRIPF